MSLNLNQQQAGAFTLFSIIYFLFLSIFDNVNCCGGGCFGGDEGGGGGGGGNGLPGHWELSERLGRAGSSEPGRRVQTPSKATVVKMAAPETQRIEVGYNGGMESAGAGRDNEHARSKIGLNQQNENNSMLGKIVQSLGFGGPAAIGNNPADVHRGNETVSPAGRGNRR